MPTAKLTWTAGKEALEAASTALTDILWPPADAVSLTKDDAAAEDSASPWRLEAYFETAPDLGAVESALAGFVGLTGPVTEELPDIDWVAHALEGLGIVRAGRFVLYGVHDADKLPDDPGDVAIRIDANQAFGTGHHPTTAGCLALLDRLAGIAPDAVLDLGTGSAVLAIAASKIWDCPVIASDIDAKSVEIARENAELNDARAIKFVEADGFSDLRIKAAGPYGFVFANILAGPLTEFAPAMAEHVVAGGRVMLAGMMAEQEAGVTEAYEAAGFRRLNRVDHKVWPVLLFVRL